ncbi:MAG: helix-turn-helix domain-containing protein [Phycisphaerales bacterium]
MVRAARQDGSLTQPLSRDVVVRKPGAYEIRDTLHRGGASYARHHHDHVSLFVVLSGCVDETASTQRVECAGGSGGFLPVGVEHRSEFEGETVHTLDIALDAQWLERMGVMMRASDGCTYSFDPALSLVGHRLLAASRGGGRIGADELLLELLGRTARVSGWGRAAEQNARWLSDVVEQLHAGSSADLATLALRAGKNAAHLCRSFRAAYGCTMSEYAAMLRVQRAAVLLRSTRQPLCRVAYEAGFSDQAHLTRAFRRHMGVTPRVFRGCAGEAGLKEPG